MKQSSFLRGFAIIVIYCQTLLAVDRQLFTNLQFQTDKSSLFSVDCMENYKEAFCPHSVNEQVNELRSRGFGKKSLIVQADKLPDHGGNRTRDLWFASPMLCQRSDEVKSVRLCDISEISIVPSISVCSIYDLRLIR